MAIPSRSAVPGTYFVTSAAFNRRRLFQVAATAELFLDRLQRYRKDGHYKLHAFVVMPDHMHLLLTPLGTTIERVVGLIKGGFSHSMGRSFPSGSGALPTIASAIARSSRCGGNTSIRILCARGWWSGLRIISTRRPIVPGAEKRTSAAEAVPLSKTAPAMGLVSM